VVYGCKLFSEVAVVARLMESLSHAGGTTPSWRRWAG
jgi:hypothetical protein